MCFGIRCDEKVEDGGEKAELGRWWGRQTKEWVFLIDVESDLTVSRSQGRYIPGIKGDASTRHFTVLLFTQR